MSGPNSGMSSSKILAAVVTLAVAGGIGFFAWMGFRAPPVAKTADIVTTPPGWVQLDAGAFTVYGPPAASIRTGETKDVRYGYIQAPNLCARYQIGAKVELAVAKSRHPDFTEKAATIDERPGMLRRTVLNTNEVQAWFPDCGSQPYLGLYMERVFPNGDHLAIEATAPSEDGLEDVMRMYKTIRFKD